MSMGKRTDTHDPLTEHDVAERLDRAAMRTLRIMLDARQIPGLFDAVKGSRYLTNSLAALAAELQAWGVEPVPLRDEPSVDRGPGTVTGQRHPCADHPAAHVLADHPLVGNPNRSTPVHCGCWLDTFGQGWTGPSCDHPAHLTDMLQQAGLLADRTPPETPTARVLAERADRRTT